MRRNTIIATIGALLLGVLTAQAQEPTPQQQVEPTQQVAPTQQEPEGFSKQIEIEKEYSAGVAQAERIEVEPRLLDTTIVRPAMRYSIVSVARKSNFTTEEISPVEFSTAGWSKPGRLYLNVGAGAPLQSEADIYWTPVQSRGRLVSVALNHEGVEAKQTNLDGQRLSALTLKNRLATHYTTPLGAGGHTRLTADVDYQGVVANPYGGVGVVAERNLIDNNALRGDVRVDGAFSANSPLAYTARLSGNYALGNFGAGESADDGSMWRYCVDFALHGLDSIKRWLPSQMTLYYYGVRSTGVSPYYDTSVTFVPEWSLRVGKWLPVHIMAGYDYMVYPGAVQSWRGLIGSVDVAWERNPKVVPWVRVSNDIDAGLMAPALWQNPYHNLLPSDSRKIYRAEVGVKGALKRAFAYELKGGFEHLSKYFFTRLVEGSPVLLWGADAEGVDLWYAEGAFTWSPLRNLTVEGDVRWNTPRYHSTAVGNHAYSIRAVKGGVSVAYAPIKRLRFAVEAAAATATSAQLVRTDGTLGEVAMPAYVDLGVRAEWLASSTCTVWLRGDNLLDQPIYEWASYRALGIGARVGVSLTIF